MKRIVLIILALSSLIVQAREITIRETRPIDHGLDQASYFPRYNFDGSLVLFSSAGFVGLWQMDLKTGETTQISSAPGAGFHPIPLKDGSFIIREDQYDRGRKLTSLVQYQQLLPLPLIEKGRFLSPGEIQQNKLLYLEGSDLRVLDLEAETMVSPNPDMLAVFNDKLSLKLLRDGGLKALQPLGEGNYIWAELSPRQDKILFTKVGDATYTCDLEGAILDKIGRARAPRWSPDGQFILYMVDIDDGSRYLESDIWISTADASKSWKVTDTKDRIELYPQWSPTGSQIIYHTVDGKLYTTTLEISD